MSITNPSFQIEFKKAKNRTDFENGRMLFKKYIQSLTFELTFQDVDRELEEITTEYNQPTGALILAYEKDQAIACIGLRKYDTDAAELKRMFVDPDYRGQQIGQKLLKMIIKEAMDLGYKSILLDTIADMNSAMKLYRSFDFKEISPYRFNPVKGAIYMKKELK